MNQESSHTVYFDLEAKNVRINFSGHKKDIAEINKAITIQNPNARINIELNAQSNFQDYNVSQLLSIMKYLK